MSSDRLSGRLMSAPEFLALAPGEQWTCADTAIARAIAEIAEDGREPDAWSGYYLRLAIASLWLAAGDRDMEHLFESLRFVGMAKWPDLRRRGWQLTPPRTAATVASLRAVHKLARDRATPRSER
jgi:hypothetical protein